MKCLAGVASQRAFLQVLYFQSAEMQQQLDRMLKENDYDAVHVQHLRMSPYLEKRKDIPRASWTCPMHSHFTGNGAKQ